MDKWAQRLFERGCSEWSRQRYPEAVHAFQEAVEAAPRCISLRATLSGALAASGCVKAAELQAQQCLALDPEFALGYLRLGNAFFLQQRYEDALAAYDTGLSHYPSHTELEEAREVVVAMLEEDDLDGSDDAAPARRRAPPALRMGAEGVIAASSGSTTPNREEEGTIVMPGDMLLPAVVEYRTDRTTSRNANSALDDHAAAVTYMRDRRWSDALTFLDFAVAKDPTHAVFRLHRSTVLFHLRQLGSALADINASLRTDPFCVSAYVRQAAILMAMRRPADALASLSAGLKLDRNNNTMEMAKARCLALISENLAHPPSEDEDDGSDGEDVVSHMTMGLGMFREPDEVDRQQPYAMHRELKPFVPRVRANSTAMEDNEEAVGLFGRGRYAEALDLLHSAVHKDPSSVVFLANRAVALTALGKYSDAISDADNVISLDPSYAKGYVRKGRVLLLQDDPARALEVYHKGLMVSPGHEELVEGRKQALRALAQKMAREGGESDEDGDGVQKGDSGEDFLIELDDEASPSIIDTPVLDHTEGDGVVSTAESDTAALEWRVNFESGGGGATVSESDIAVVGAEENGKGPDTTDELVEALESFPMPPTWKKSGAVTSGSIPPEADPSAGVGEFIVVDDDDHDLVGGSFVPGGAEDRCIGTERDAKSAPDGDNAGLAVVTEQSPSNASTAVDTVGAHATGGAVGDLLSFE